MHESHFWTASLDALTKGAHRSGTSTPRSAQGSVLVSRCDKCHLLDLHKRLSAGSAKKHTLDGYTLISFVVRQDGKEKKQATAAEES